MFPEIFHKSTSYTINAARPVLQVVPKIMVKSNIRCSKADFAYRFGKFLHHQSRFVSIAKQSENNTTFMGDFRRMQLSHHAQGLLFCSLPVYFPEEKYAVIQPANFHFPRSNLQNKIAALEDVYWL